MAEGTAEAARTMRSEGAIENEAGSGELLDTAKVNSTATAGGAGWEERTFAGTMSWEEMVEKVRRETRYVSAACARSGTRSGGQGGNQVGRCAVVDAAAAVQAVDEAMAKWAALERTAELVMQRGLDRSARSKRVQKSWYAERHEQHMQLMERALPLGLSQQLDALGAGVKSAKGVVVDGKQMVLVEPGAVAAARVLAVGWRATVAAVEMQAEARIEAAWRHHYEEQQSRWEELRGRLQKFKKALDGAESFCRLARKASYAVDAVVKTCEDGVLEYTPLHGASCSLSSALDRVCIRTRELADRAQDMRGGGDSEAD